MGGLIAKFKSKPKLSADNFDGLSAHKDDAVTGGGGSQGKGDTKEQIDTYRETLTESEQTDLLVDFTLEPSKALKRVIKDGKKDGYIFARDKLEDELVEMNNGGAFDDIELDAVAMQSLLSRSDEQEMVKTY